MQENGHVTEFNGGGNGCYNINMFNGGGMVMLREVVSLTEGEWSCYGGSQLKGGGMVMLQRLSV